MDNPRQELELEQVNMTSFEHGYKECFRELCEWEKNGVTNKKIAMIFDKDGNWKGHVLDVNSHYSLEDLEKNNRFCLSNISRIELGEKGIVAAWKEEVRQEMKITD